ncbi:hypothetical protein [Marinifilum sp.]|uniref:hypothetical protein n=1 Tax=Marinifilum sp. TaxID=2033137 RepID=UPI003BAD66BB
MKLLTVLRVFIATLLILFASKQCVAAKAPIKFGKVTKDELLMNRYDKDTSAIAVYLCDYGVSEMLFMNTTGNFQYNFTLVPSLIF